MLPKYHLIFGLIFTLIIYLIFQITPFQVIILFTASYLIDFDHYLFYFLKTNNISLKNAKNYFLKLKKNFLSLSPKKRKDYKRPILVFHGIEFWIFLIFLSYLNKIFLFVLIGVMFHMFFDFIEIIYIREPLAIKLSCIYVYLTNKNKKVFI